MRCLRNAPALLLSLLAYFTLAIPVARAEEPDTPDRAEKLEVNTSAEALRLRPTFRGNFDSESGGIAAFGSVDAFFPVFQTPGQSTFYFYPKLRFDFDDSSTVGGNLIFGYRNFSQERDRILGGYLALDVRDTGESVFPQVGFGFERLGHIDIRANGYVPLGDTNQETDSISSLTSRLTDTFFQGNRLQLETSNTITTVSDREVALGGFDVEIGGSIFRWNRSGNLELFGGTYYLGGDNVSTVGGRGRVALTPVDGLQFGIGIQGDSVFGTRVFFNARAQMPHPKAIAPTDEEKTALEEAGPIFARMDDSVARVDSVVVDRQQDVDANTFAAIEPAINPETGEPYLFTFVSPGGMSSGTFEDPFGTVQEGLDATVGDGNDIVFVTAKGNRIVLSPFSIPDNVRVLSDGTLQEIETAQMGTVQLPGSGTGVLPLIFGAVTQGVNTELSGFIEFNPDIFFEIQTIGNATVTGSTSGSLTLDTLDSLSAISLSLSNGAGSVSDAEIESFLGLNAGDLDGLNGDATEGSAALIRLDFSTPVNADFQFDWNFLTNEFTPDLLYNDFSFVSVNGTLEELADTNFPTFVPSTGFSEETGIQTFTTSDPDSSFVTIGVGVSDLIDPVVDSGLDISNLQLDIAIP